jgi:hypothetical protein
MKSEYISLTARIRTSLEDIEQVIIRIHWLLDKYTATVDDGYLDGTALNLHGFYSGVERIFKDIVSHIDRSLPSTAEWHQDLLIQVSSELTDLRPAILSKETRTLLDEFRGFRHVVRNVYTFNFRPARILELAQGLDQCFNLLKNDLYNFINFLEKV